MLSGFKKFFWLCLVDSSLQSGKSRNADGLSLVERLSSFLRSSLRRRYSCLKQCSRSSKKNYTRSDLKIACVTSVERRKGQTRADLGVGRGGHGHPFLALFL